MAERSTAAEISSGRVSAWAANAFIQPDLDLVEAINAGDYRGSNNQLQGINPIAIFNHMVLPAVRDRAA